MRLALQILHDVVRFLFIPIVRWKPSWLSLHCDASAARVCFAQWLSGRLYTTGGGQCYSLKTLVAKQRH